MIHYYNRLIYTTTDETTISRIPKIKKLLILEDTYEYLLNLPLFPLSLKQPFFNIYVVKQITGIEIGNSKFTTF